VQEVKKKLVNIVTYWGKPEVISVPNKAIPSNVIYSTRRMLELNPELSKSVLAIRRIRMFLGLPDPNPDPLATSTDLTALDPSLIKQK
jgi:hypothetical protein